MPLFEEDPALLSKSRLKSDLVAHNVPLPPARSKKEVLVELHVKHIDQKHAADFSSDEEDQVQDLADKEEALEDAEEAAEILDPGSLTDDGLKAALLEHGVKAGPIVASTRALYEKKLRTLLQSDGQNRVNGSEKGVLYSDSEEEEEEEEEEMEEDSERAKDETLEQSDQQESSQNGGFVYHQCFLPASSWRARAARNEEPRSKRNSGNALKSSERGWSRCSQIPVGISKASSVHQRLGLGSGAQQVSSKAQPGLPDSSRAFSITELVEEMESRRSLCASTDTEGELNGGSVQEHWSRSNRQDMPVSDKDNIRNQSLYYTPKASPNKLRIKLPQEPVKDTFKDLFPDTVVTPTGIYATRRKPIKGAAGRPVQYAYPDTPASPTTQERREVERRLMPLHVRVLVFFIVVVVLYLVYICVEDNSFSPFSLEMQDTPVASEQE